MIEHLSHICIQSYCYGEVLRDRRIKPEDILTHMKKHMPNGDQGCEQCLQDGYDQYGFES